jgi:hypothetical protein
MITATTNTTVGSLPEGTTIEITELVDLGHYSSQLGYYDLKLADGSTLKMVKFYDDLTHT